MKKKRHLFSLRSIRTDNWLRPWQLSWLEHHTGSVEVISSNPVQSLQIFSGLIEISFIGNITARIILHLISFLQFISDFSYMFIVILLIIVRIMLIDITLLLYFAPISAKLKAIRCAPMTIPATYVQTCLHATGKTFAISWIVN